MMHLSFLRMLRILVEILDSNNKTFLATSLAKLKFWKVISFVQPAWVQC